jgi:hypothetical protein
MLLLLLLLWKKEKKLKIGFEMRMCGLPGLWRWKRTRRGRTNELAASNWVRGQPVNQPTPLSSVATAKIRNRFAKQNYNLSLCCLFTYNSLFL